MEGILGSVNVLQGDMVIVKSERQSMESSIGLLTDTCQAVSARVSALESAVPALERNIFKSCELVENRTLSRFTSAEESLKAQSNATQLNVQQIYTTLSTLSNTVNTLIGTVQVVKDRYEIVQGGLKENKVIQAELESNVVQYQKDLNSLQYQFSKIQSEAHHSSVGTRRHLSVIIIHTTLDVHMVFMYPLKCLMY